VTIKKAIKILDWWISKQKIQIQKIKTESDFNDPEIPQILLENQKTIISNLKLIRKEIIPNCKHPKEMHDICDNQKYCMNCNFDL